MTTDSTLENYLARLDRVLGPFAASERAEIITEIKSHALSAREKNPETPMSQILAAFGEAETVANRYLLERGMKPVKPPISPIVKWLVVGFLGTVAMVFAFLCIVLWKLSPLIKISDAEDRLTLLGGAIDLSDKGIKIGGLQIDDEGIASVASGSWTPESKSAPLNAKFGAGRFEIQNSPDAAVSWKCRGRKPDTIHIQSGEKEVLLDLTSMARCNLLVPEGLKLNISANNGKLSLLNPHFPVQASMLTGKAEIAPDPDTNYRFDLSVASGKIDEFTSSPDPKAYTIEIKLQTGKIEKIEAEDDND